MDLQRIPALRLKPAQYEQKARAAGNAIETPLPKYKCAFHKQDGPNLVT
jgi:alanine-alpha-ketoisovalerate/valine-pyruvate aminotransferase